MPKRLLILLSLALLLASAFPVHHTLAQDDDPFADMPERTVEVDGTERTYRLFLPPQAEEAADDTALPLLIVYHVAGSNGQATANRTGLNQYAEEDGVIVAYPNGPFGYWEYAIGLPETEAGDFVNDDLAFFETMLADITADFPVDESRVYALGLSNGARMAYRLGCEYPDRLAGIAGAISTMTARLAVGCPEDGRISAMILHGTEDTVSPWEGETFYDDEGEIEAVALSVPDTVNFWAAHNNCDPEPEVSDVPDANPEDSISVRQVEFSDCDEEVRVVFYAVLGGEHSWLGGNPALVEEEYYNPSGSASQLVWDFFGLGASE
jgi:polyhydroxybutyrate depolymerase